MKTKTYKVTLVEAWTHYHGEYRQNRRDALSKVVTAADPEAAIKTMKIRLKKENGYKERDFRRWYNERGGEYLDREFRVEEIAA